MVLKSRIGSPFVVEVTSFDTDGKWPAQLPIAKEKKNHPTALRYQRIQIPSADVMSWPAIVPLTKPGEEFLFDAGRITSYWNQDEKGMGAEQAKWLGAQCGEKRIVDTQADRSSVKARGIDAGTPANGLKLS